MIFVIVCELGRDLFANFSLLMLQNLHSCEFQIQKEMHFLLPSLVDEDLLRWEGNHIWIIITALLVLQSLEI